jgi:hypothetical protein
MYENLLRRIAGQGISDLIGGVDSIQIGIDESVRSGMRSPDGALVPTRLVNHWVRNLVVSAPAACDRVCVEGRSKYILDGLAVWKAQAEKGLSELHNPSALGK